MERLYKQGGSTRGVGGIHGPLHAAALPARNTTLIGLDFTSISNEQGVETSGIIGYPTIRQRILAIAIATAPCDFFRIGANERRRPKVCIQNIFASIPDFSFARNGAMLLWPLVYGRGNNADRAPGFWPSGLV
jgi:hypothetical protein